jgi:hypothetical protein
MLKPPSTPPLDGASVPALGVSPARLRAALRSAAHANLRPLALGFAALYVPFTIMPLARFGRAGIPLAVAGVLSSTGLLALTGRVIAHRVAARRAHAVTAAVLALFVAHGLLRCGVSGTNEDVGFLALALLAAGVFSLSAPWLLVLLGAGLGGFGLLIGAGVTRVPPAFLMVFLLSAPGIALLIHRARVAGLGREEDLRAQAEWHDAARARALAELRRAKDAAETANRTKDVFLATLSHEIRTPLSAAIGVTEMLLDTELTPAQRNDVTLVRKSGETVLALINDLLDLGKIQAGKLELERVDFELRDAVAPVAELFGKAAQQKGLALTVQIDPEVPNRVQGDPRRLRQVLTNLVSNAVKFTERGQVRIQVTSDEGRVTGETCHLRFAVQDTGIGIPTEVHPLLFAPFSQADPSIAGRFGGTGLGLSICKQLVTLVGGEIGVHSESERGATFWFTWPLIRLAGEAAEAPADIGPPPVTGPAAAPVLVVEDNAVNRLVAVRMLDTLGHRAEGVASGAEALARIAATQYAAVLMDIYMPDLDGIETTRRIRHWEATARDESVDPRPSPTTRHRSRVPIIALTANAVAGDRERCLAAGMDDYLIKPVRLLELQAALARWVGRPQAAPIDQADVLARVDGDIGILRRAADLFLSDCEQVVADMRSALAGADALALQRAAHSLKGGAAILGAKPTAAAAARIEELARAGDLSGVRAACQRLEDELARLKPALAALLGAPSERAV